MTPRSLAPSKLIALLLSATALAACANSAYLKLPGSNKRGNSLGSSIDIYENRLVIGAIGVDVADVSGCGAFYSFRQVGSNWHYEDGAVATHRSPGDFLGSSIAIHGKTVVVGAPHEDSNAKTVNGDATNNSSKNAGAAYVFVLDNSNEWKLQAYLKAPDPSRDDLFGTSVDIYEDRIAVGAPGNQGKGSAYLFDRVGTQWRLIEQFTPHAPGLHDLYQKFGTSVALGDDVVLVGAPENDSDGRGITRSLNNNDNAKHSGAVFVYRYLTDWRPEVVLKSPNSDAGDRFGDSVAIHDNWIVVGAPNESSSVRGIDEPGEDNLRSQSGAAYVYRRHYSPLNPAGWRWNEHAYLKADNADIGDHFGQSVAIQGDLIVVGAPNEAGVGKGTNQASSNLAADSGALYAFRRSGESWTQQLYLKSFNSEAEDGFGTSVAVGTNLVAGTSPGEDAAGPVLNQTDNNASLAGAGYVLSNINNLRPEISLRLTTPPGDAPNPVSFGTGAANKSNTLEFEITNTGNANLDNFRFERHGDHPGDFRLQLTGMQQSLPPKSTTRFKVVFDPAGLGERNGGFSIERDGRWVTGRNLTGVGLRISPIYQESYLKASNTSQHDAFGTSVALGDNLLAVGAPGEDSADDPEDDSATNSGAVYLYRREGIRWHFDTMLKPPGPSVGFGSSVALFGNTLVVGAPHEGSDAFERGAVYVFQRNESDWVFQKRLQPDVSVQDFGWSVATSDDVIIVGSRVLPQAVFVYRRQGGEWNEEDVLTPRYPSASYGTALAISGDTIVVGAERDAHIAKGVNPIPDLRADASYGSAYVYRWRDGAWHHEAYFKASDARREQHFGSSVGVSGDVIAVGARGVQRLEALGAGAAYVFERSEGQWEQTALLTSFAPPERFEKFGASLALSGTSLLIGAPGENSYARGVDDFAGNSLSHGSGAAYLYTRGTSGWERRGYLKPSNTRNSDPTELNFGSSVALFSDTAAIGGIGDPSSATGVNGLRTLIDAPGAGAAHVFYDPLVPRLASFAALTPQREQLSSNDVLPNFGPVGVGLASATYRLTIYNDSPASLRSLRLTLSGPHATSFLVDDAHFPATLPPYTAATIPITAIPQESGNLEATITFNSSDSANSPFALELRAQADPVPNGYAAWVNRFALHGDHAAPLSTPFRDQIPNLLKFAFNLDGSRNDQHVLTATSHSGLPRFFLQDTGDQQFFVVQYIRRRDGSLTYLPQWSPSLEAESWQAFETAIRTTPIDESWERVTQRTPVPEDQNSLFGRVDIRGSL